MEKGRCHMKAFILGGTGFIGVNLANTLLGEGHDVTVMGQSTSRPPGLSRNVKVVAGDARRPGPWQDHVSESRLLINLTGASIFSRWTAAYKKLLRETRIISTRNIVDALPRESHEVTLFSASAVGYYGFRGDEELAEEDRHGDDFLARLCVDWEAEADRATEKGARVVITRFGIVLGKGGGALGQMIPFFRFGLGGPLGCGRQWFSWIHMDDLLGGLRFLLGKREARGPYNLVSPGVVRNRDLAKGLGEALHRPAILPAPSFMVRLAMGEFGDVVLKGQRVTPSRLTAAGYSFTYPGIAAALAAVLRD
jgi:uncharacterized protein (TIGR01777 family)